MKSFACLLFFCILLPALHSMDYSDLEAVGLSCPDRDSCDGYNNKRTYMDRSCECDAACATYRDCCIDAEEKSSAEGVTRNDLECMHYGDNMFTGVYAVSRCNEKWNGSVEIKEKCEGPLDLSDPIRASPATSLARVTYKNLYCAECNHAGKQWLTLFPYKLTCRGLDDEEIRANLSYDRTKNRWGVVRSNEQGNSTFVECQIVFDVPAQLNRSVRFCRANIASDCTHNWTGDSVRSLCHAYTAVVYDRHRGYRNPHCALCHHKKIAQLSCSPDFVRRRRYILHDIHPFSFTALIDSLPNCPQGSMYDPYMKKCRKLMCALPGFVMQGNRCVRRE